VTRDSVRISDVKRSSLVQDFPVPPSPSQPILNRPVPVAPLSKTCVYGLSLAGIAGSNPTGGIDFCLLRVLCAVRSRSLRRFDHSYRGVLPSVVCLTECDRESSIMGRPWTTGAVAPW